LKYLKMSKHHPDLVMCRKQPGVAIGRLCVKCDGKCKWIEGRLQKKSVKGRRRGCSAAATGVKRWRWSSSVDRRGADGGRGGRLSKHSWLA
jgi:hypothetical protein